MIVEGNTFNSSSYLLRNGNAVGTICVHFTEHHNDITNHTYLSVTKITVDSSVALNNATVSGTTDINAEPTGDKVVIDMSNCHLQAEGDGYIVVGIDQYPTLDVVHDERGKGYVEVGHDVTVVNAASYTMKSQKGVHQTLELTSLDYKGATKAFMMGLAVGMGLHGDCSTWQGGST